MIGGCVWNCKYNGLALNLKDIFCEDTEGLGFELRCFMLYNFKLGQSGNILVNLFPCENKEKALF